MKRQETLGRATKKAGVYLCLGVNEKIPLYQGMLFNSLVFIDPDGQVIGKHRKLLPTNREKVFWHRGDGIDVKAVFETGLGRVGGLICYEHLQPLLKYAMYAQGEQIHCACWPGWPHYPPPGRSNKQVIDAASRSYAIQGQCFVIISSVFVPEKVADKAGLGNAAWVFFGGSGIVNPAGEYVAGPVYDEETVVYADLDMSLIPLRKTTVDTMSRDTRWDFLSLNANFGTYQPLTEGTHMQPCPDPLAPSIYNLIRALDKTTSKLEEIL